MKLNKIKMEFADSGKEQEFVEVNHLLKALNENFRNMDNIDMILNFIKKGDL